MIGGGAHIQVSGLGHQEPGSGVQVRAQVQEICHLSSIQPSIQPSTQSSTQSSVVNRGKLGQHAVLPLPRGSVLK